MHDHEHAWNQVADRLEANDRRRHALRGKLRHGGLSNSRMSPTVAPYRHEYRPWLRQTIDRVAQAIRTNAPILYQYALEVRALSPRSAFHRDLARSLIYTILAYDWREDIITLPYRVRGWHVPRTCWVDASAWTVDWREWSGPHLRVHGVAVAVDNHHHWWCSLRVMMNGEAVAVVRRARSSWWPWEERGENLVAAGREESWATALRIAPRPGGPPPVDEKRGWIERPRQWLAWNGLTAPLAQLDLHTAPTRILHIGSGADASAVWDALDRELETPHNGLSNERAALLHRLDLFRFTSGILW